MRAVNLACLLLILLLVPSVSDAHWWSRQKTSIPNDLNFSGEGKGRVYCKEFRIGSRSHRFSFYGGRWFSTPACSGEGEFCGTTLPLDVSVTKTELNFCPLLIDAGDCTICVEFNGPMKLKSYGFACYFTGSGLARVTGDGEEFVEDGIKVKVKGYLRKWRGSYRLYGKLYGHKRVDSDEPGVLRKYKFVYAKFSAHGEESDEPCECLPGCEECDLDEEPPVITCPDDVTIQCGRSTSSSNTGQATATDNCDDNPTIEESDEVQRGRCSGSGQITRTFTATDSAGNESSCTQIITVVDTTPPGLRCPADITVNNGEQNDLSITGNATAQDRCTGDDVTITHNDGIDRENSTIARTFTATDPCGNSISCTQTITVVVDPCDDDQEAPQITCPGDITVECGEDTSSANTGMATATDNCDLDVTIEESDEVLRGDCPGAGTIIRTFTATDAAGNSSNCTQTITIEDTTAPSITCPDDITVDDGQQNDTNVTGTASADDTCSQVTITFNDVIDRQNSTITRTWTATDQCGNSASCDQTITVTPVDDEDPQITCPDDVTVECGEDTSSSSTGVPNVSDNSDQDPTIEESDQFVAACGDTGVITRTWTATDAAGNSASCTQTITIVDTTAPQINCPADVTVQSPNPTDPSATGEATASDNCGAPTVTFEDQVNGNVITRTWTATDACGNSSNCDQTITVEGGGRG